MTQPDITSTFWKKLETCPTVMIGVTGQDAHSEPMRVFFDEDLPNELYIYLAKGNRLFEAVEQTRHDAMLQFVDKDHTFFACITGNLARIDDPALIDKFWSDSVGAWFEKGREDPDLRMVRMRLHHAEMWKSEIGLGSKLKRLFGGVLGPDDIDSEHAEVALG